MSIKKKIILSEIYFDFWRDASRKQKRMQRGFTLVELLVVISIIALLLSILMPALAKARGQAEGVICSSRLNQAGLASILYAESNKDYCVSPRSTSDVDRWWVKLAPYFNFQGKDSSYNMTFKILKMELVLCPTAKKQNASFLQNKSWRRQSFGLNQNIDAESIVSYGFSVTIKKMTDPKRPGNTCLIGDGYFARTWGGWWDTIGYLQSNIPDAVHSGKQKANILFFDNHVSSLKKSELPKGITSSTGVKQFWLGGLENRR